MMIVMPCSFSRKRMVRMSSTSALDRPAMASSEMSSFGRAAMARASSSLRISICVSPAGRRCAFASSPMVFKISPASALPSAPARPDPAYSSGMPRFSSTVMLVKGLGIWKLRAMPSRVRWCGGSAVISRPSKRIGAAVDRQHAGDAVDERRLAGAVRADEAEALAGLDRQGHAVQRREAAEALDEPLHLEQRGGHRVSGPAGAAPGPGSPRARGRRRRPARRRR